jgi:hypothetical protein
MKYIISAKKGKSDGKRKKRREAKGMGQRK